MKKDRTFAGLSAVAAAAVLVVSLLHGAPSPQEKSKESAYTKWLEEEVVYIIAPEERAAFLKLTSDPEKMEFIRQFWARRGEAVKTEHYGRIGYVNLHYASSTREGWRTERGKTYILKGPPDEIETHQDRHIEAWLYRKDPGGPIVFTIE